jgi:hypothetical protein
MRRYGHKRKLTPLRTSSNIFRMMVLAVIVVGSPPHEIWAQESNDKDLVLQMEQLKSAMSKAEAQIEESQRELIEMHRQLNSLESRITGQPPTESPNSSSSTPDTLATDMRADIQEIRDRQDMEESQIATQEQTKVESESKYPVKLTGLVLLTGFINTRAVDMPSTPTIAIYGTGSTGATLRQTILGFDARGPHLFGATSYADLRVDFNGSPQSNTTAGVYAGYYGTNTTLLRFRTAHAGLEWANTEAYFSLDRPILSPNTPTSLTAVAEPALAWSGNLWTWNPQVGLTQNLSVSPSHSLQLQAALIDVGDAPVTPVSPGITTLPTASSAERSRWPGTELHLALINSKLPEEGNRFGIGGYFSPHLTPTGQRFDSWAATVDGKLHLPARLELSGSAYRGLGLGGLGGGAYKDYGYRVESVSNESYFRPFDDIGGWAQLKEKVNEKLQFNAAFGLDNLFAQQLRHYAVANVSPYQNLARNRTYTGNVIYSPSAYLMFSLEYRHLQSAQVLGPTNGSDILGIAAGYKF